MSSFQDLYAHAAMDRSRAMQFLAIQDIRLKAVRELKGDPKALAPMPTSVPERKIAPVVEPKTQSDMMADPRLNDILGAIPGATVVGVR